VHTAYDGLEPAELWRHFDALNGIPRPSGLEAAARDYVRRIAEGAGLAMRTDSFGNSVVALPARGGNAGTKPVAIQSHLDMVKAAAEGVVHDFDTDPIIPRREGGRIYATGTTLGADNGIGAG
jgi:dipeptidase D